MFPLAFLLALALSTYAHSEAPKTPEQLRVYQDLQAAAYHCAPAVAVYTAERQRDYAQRVLSGQTGHLTASELFDGGGAVNHDVSQKSLECSPVSATKIRNNTCVLAPEVTQGPYYMTSGHPIRSNIAEYEPGLLFFMNIGVIDVETCKPVPNLLIDVWQANATGHYAAHPTPAPHLVDELPKAEGPRRGLLTAFPRSVEGETFGRGALPSDENGVVQFTSIFPGYYTGRATHVHVRVHPEWSILPNGTFTSGRLSHTGQFFFEDQLNVAVDKLWPYSTNPIANIRGRTRNWNDGLNIFEDAQVDGYKSVFETKLLGGVLQQGVIGYITMAVNISASYPM